MAENKLTHQEMIDKNMNKTHIGDGLYLIYEGDYVHVAVNHHNNIVASIVTSDVPKIQEFVNRMKELFD